MRTRITDPTLCPAQKQIEKLHHVSATCGKRGATKPNRYDGTSMATGTHLMDTYSILVPRQRMLASCGLANADWIADTWLR